MTVILIRTLVFFALLTAIMRLTGKRQIGEMQVSEFVTAFLISEMAALPITDIDIPFTHGLVAICSLGCFETILSYAVHKSVNVRRLIMGEPIVLVSNGKVVESALSKARITLDDIFSQIRIDGYRNINEVQYVILEQNGKMSVLPKPEFDKVTPDDMGIEVRNSGMSHPVIIDGKVSKCFMGESPLTPKQISAEARKKSSEISDVLYMTVDNSGKTVTVLKGDNK